MRYILISLISFLAACGGGSGSDTVDEFVEDVTETGVEQTSTDTFGRGGNLYKPEADETSSGAGFPVVLFDGSFSEQFESCEIPLADGTITQLDCNDRSSFTQFPFSCFSNPLADGLRRQTWRATVPCEQLGEVRVTCRLGADTFIFEAPNGQLGNVCTEFR